MCERHANNNVHIKESIDGLDPINAVSILSLAALLDPRSRGLTYLNDMIAVKQLLNRSYYNE